MKRKKLTRKRKIEASEKKEADRPKFERMPKELRDELNEMIRDETEGRR